MTTEPTLCNKPTIQELGTYRLVTVADFPDTISRLVQDGGPVSLDVEATGLDPWTNKLVCIQVGDGQLASICDVRHATEAEWERLADTIRLLFSGRVQLLGHNIRFDVLTLAVKAGIGPYELRHLRLYDTMLAEQVILGGVDAPDGKGRERANLAATAARYGIPLTKDPRNYFIDLDKRPEWNLPLPEEQLAYSALDVLVLPPICDAQAAEIAAKGLSDTIALEMAVARATIAMELAGVHLDEPGYRQYLDKVKVLADGVERRIQAALFPGFLAVKKREQVQQTNALLYWQDDKQEAIAMAKASWEAQPKDFRPQWGDVRKHTLKQHSVTSPRPRTPAPLPDHLNLDSPSQLLEALAFVGIPLCSTEAEMLEEEAKRRPDVAVLGLLCRFRKLNHTLKSFGESILCKIQADGRLHPSWKQIGGEDKSVATGRMSCSKPALQEIPAHDDLDGDSVRRHVTAAPGCLLVSCDYSQMEMRILAERSQDAALMEIFDKGWDIYSRLGVAVGLAPKDTFTKQQGKVIPFGDGNLRDAMKTLTLAISYLMGPQSLGHNLGVSEETARGYLDNFYASYPGIRRYQEATAASALALGYSTTIGGRRRTFRILPPPQRHQYQTWDGFKEALKQWRKDESRIRRQAVNATIQGTGADVMKLALTLVFQRLPAGACLIAAIHDEVLCEAPESLAGYVAHILEQAMEEAARFYLPTVALGEFHAVQSAFWMKE